MRMKFGALYKVMLLGMGGLTLAAFFCSNMFPANYYEYTILEMDFVGIHLALLAILLLFFRFLRPKLQGCINWEKAVCFLLPCSLLISFGISLFWAIQCEYIPVWDPEYICRSASILAQGGMLGEKDMAYLNQYPHQIGVVWLFRLLIGMFGTGGESYMTLHIFFALCMPLIVWNGYLLTDAFFEDKEVDCYYLLGATGCLALFFYVNFLYSDVPGILLALMAMNGIVSYSKTGKKGWGILGVLLFILAVVVRKNNLILVIAATGMWFLYGVIKREKKRVVEAVLSVFVIVVGSQLATDGLCSHYHVSQDKAEPSIVWVAMGAQRSGRGAGWYNGYIEQVYNECEGNPELIKAEATKELKKSLMSFVKNPAEGLAFYIDKLLIQWNQPCYQSLGVSAVYEEMPEGIVEAIYQGRAYQSTRSYFDCYQWLIYMGFTIYLWKNCKKKEVSVYIMIPILAVLGGVAFSLLWEAKSRYILPYLVLMLPYAAKGWRDFGKSTSCLDGNACDIICDSEKERTNARTWKRREKHE